MASEHASPPIKKHVKHDQLQGPQVPLAAHAEGGDAPPSALESYAGGPENLTYGQDRISIDIPIPSDKVGLIIGKGGKTIKYFQEKCGAKMHIIQQTTSADEQDKVLRIMGPLPFVEHGRQLVHDLVCQSKDLKLDPLQSETVLKSPLGSSDGHPASEPCHWKTVHYSVPKTAVGLIIGKGGETIRRIRTQTGARIRFQPGPKAPDGPESPDSIAIVTGKEEQICRACEQIDSLISLSSRGAGGPSRGQLLPMDPLSPQQCPSDVDPHSLKSECSQTQFTVSAPTEHGQGDLKYAHVVPSQQQLHDLLSSAIPITSFPVLADPSQTNLLQPPPATITQFPLGPVSSSMPNWLEYFTPERQQANADAWEQQVKAEQEEDGEGQEDHHSYSHEQDTQIYGESVKDSPNVCHCEGQQEEVQNDHSNSSAPLQWSAEAEYEHQHQVQAAAGDGDAVADSSSYAQRQQPNEAPKTLLHPPPGILPHPVFVPAYHQNHTGDPALALGARPQATNFLYPVASHAARFITFYYDPNTNSIIVLNQWPSA